MTPQVPQYVLSFESLLRPLVMTIALGLIWLGAARMPASAKSRYTTATVLSAVFIGWEVVAQYLGAANTYLANIENPPAVPLHWLVAAQSYRVAGGIFLVLWAGGRLPWQFALPAGIGDVTTGIVAVVVAGQLAQKAIGARGGTYACVLF